MTDAAAIAREPGCTCDRCGRKYVVDLMLADDQWAALIEGEPQKADGTDLMLCGACIMMIVDRKARVRGQFAAYRLEQQL